MALRDVKAFDTKQMTQLKTNMARGASKKQVQKLNEAINHVVNANVTRNF